MKTNGELNSNVVKINGIADSWKKYTGELKALRTEDSRLCIMADTEGVFYLDFVTLVPESSQLWMDGKYGPLRKDMMQALADLHPTFMRFREDVLQREPIISDRCSGKIP